MVRRAERHITDALRRSFARSPVVDVGDLPALVEGWAELDRRGEVRGGLVLVAVDGGTGVVVGALRAIGATVDVVGLADAGVVVVLIDGRPDEVEVVAVGLARALGAAGRSTWVVAGRIAGRSARAAMAASLRALDDVRRAAPGVCIRVDGTVLTTPLPPRDTR